MIERLKNMFFGNLGLKLLALLLAVLVWAIVAGRERTFSERTFRVPVEVSRVSDTLEVRNLNPEEVRVTLRGPSRTVGELPVEALRLVIDLNNARRSGKLTFFSEDHLSTPSGFSLVAVQPKTIVLSTEELVSRPVAVQPQFKNRLAANLKLKKVTLLPDKVTAIAYKSQISISDVVYTEEIDLATVSQTTTLTVPLKQASPIIKFKEGGTVVVTLEIEKK